VHNNFVNSYDERPINSKGAYEIPSAEELGQIEDIEVFEDDLDEKEVAQQDSAHMRKVIDGVHNFFKEKLTS